MFPEIESIEKEENLLMTYPFNGKSFLFDFKKKDFIYNNGKPVEVKGNEALKVWIEKIIRTEKFKFKIYKDIEYGVSIEDLIGSSFSRDFVRAELEREITEALLKNPYILNLQNWTITHEGSSAIISFTVNTEENNFSFEAVI